MEIQKCYICSKKTYIFVCKKCPQCCEYYCLKCTENHIITIRRYNELTYIICLACIGETLDSIPRYEEVIRDLEKENRKLKLEIKYQPDGEGFKETKEHFESLIRK